MRLPGPHTCIGSVIYYKRTFDVTVNSLTAFACGSHPRTVHSKTEGMAPSTSLGEILFSRNKENIPLRISQNFSQGFPDPPRFRKCMHLLTSALWAEPSLPLDFLDFSRGCQLSAGQPISSGTLTSLSFPTRTSCQAALALGLYDSTRPCLLFHTDIRPPGIEGSQCNQARNLYARRVRPGALR